MELIESYGEAQHRFELAGGYSYPVTIKKVLTGLGFTAEDFRRPMFQLSGGQKTRALLARLLLDGPDLLILDEPTNHLDIRAIEWLEGWLKDYPGALLLVSHDRYFMDNVVNYIWELIFGRVEEYRGNYSHYVRQRDERHTHLLKEYERQQDFIEKEQDYIRRNIAGQNTRQAQGRRKRLNRYLKDVALARPREHKTMRLNLQTDQRSGDEVIKTKSLVIGYQDDQVPLFTVPDIILKRGECAALIGPNGAGKSTILKTILGRLPPLEGEVTIGANVHVGYFAQAHEGLNDRHTVLEEILAAKEMPLSEARTYLGMFVFSSDDVYKQIGDLSGGERGRVALAKLALSGANVLLLDEPTNHLDIPSQEILEGVLNIFAGTILLVSHDRYFISNLATQVWAIDAPIDGETTEMVVFEGPYRQYASVLEGKVLRPNDRVSETEPPPVLNHESSDEAPINPYQRRKRLAQVETAINTLEISLVNLSGELEEATQAGDMNRVSKAGAAYSQAEADLNILLAEWETLVSDG
jgi:ATP-binding cassette subfamily F protein 3